MKTKVQMMWEVYREAEEKFIEKFAIVETNLSELEELLKAIRGTEYRRGKEDAKNE